MAGAAVLRAIETMISSAAFHHISLRLSDGRQTSADCCKMHCWRLSTMLTSAKRLLQAVQFADVTLPTSLANHYLQPACACRLTRILIF